MAEYTKQQKKAIDLRDRNILVSASAGTGKTAVLTERILQLILDKDDPANIDEMAVLTFTNAAAAEMKQRIEKKLGERQEIDDNGHIRRQMALIPHAQITTLHSMCINIIKNYFYTIGIDPSFRIGDDQEMELMRSEVMEEMLEEKYEEKSPSFIRVAEIFASGKSDDKVSETIFDIYRNSESHPWPKEWLNRCKESYYINSDKDLDASDWITQSGIIGYTKEILSDAVKRIDEAISLCGTAEGFDKLYVFLLEEKEKIGCVIKCGTYSEYGRGLRGLTFARFPSISGEDKKPLKDKIKALRDAWKKNIGAVIDKYYYEDEEEICKKAAGCGEIIGTLCDMAAEFRERFIKAKRENNVMDFNDAEHYALEILTDEENGAARELREKYRYILVDEYQDINEVQETIISEISREKDGKPNIFMVGDVKQSIYTFRLARPEIFEHKWETYTDSESLNQRVTLKRNFRSSPAILAAANFIFSGIMKKQLGNVEYDGSHEFEYDKPESKKDYGEPAEVIYISEEGLKETEYNKRRLEAVCIAEKIKEITDPDAGVVINDPQTGEKRTAGYGDIVILLRSMKGWSEEFAETLMEHQIPVSADEHTGYFSAREIQLTISMLKIIDNPHQDIALTAVLRSVFGGFDDDELAVVRAHKKKCDMFAALYAAAEEGEGALGDKCRDFIHMLESLRDAAPYMRVYELIEKIYAINDFFLNMKVMPQGERRTGNLMMLADKAVEFEGTDKRSLFDFLEYIEKMKSAEVDFGENDADPSGNGAVRIMSTHKSKGLEFPVVFVAGMGKQPNFQDIRKNIVIHSDAGIGMYFFDMEKRVKYGTLMRNAVARRVISDIIGEELRILYVAVTRAKDKLILTGTVPEPYALFEKCRAGEYSYVDMTKNNTTYYTWLTPFFMTHPLWPFGGGEGRVSDECAPVKFSIYSASDAEEKELAHVLGNEIIKERLILAAKEDKDEGELASYMDKEAAYRYPYESDIKLVSKISVSEIKRRAAEIEDEEAVKVSWEENTDAEYVPWFAKEDEDDKIKGARRGTIYHSFMEHIDLAAIANEDDIKAMADDLIIRGVLPENVIKDRIISVKKIWAFCGSGLAKRMKKAQENGMYHAEQPFVMGVRAKDIYPDTDSEEVILVQGIIDALFEEENEIVLVDYKTDRILPGEEEKLAKRYYAQMLCYKTAIEKAMGKKVKEMILYSFALNKEIKI